ncbi:hypothetical protein D3C75_1245520 [compost metagenome]
MHKIRLQPIQEGFPHQLGTTAAPRIARIRPADATEGLELADAFLWHQAIQGLPDFADTIGEGTVDRHPYFVVASVAGHGFGQ